MKENQMGILELYIKISLCLYSYVYLFIYLSTYTPDGLNSRMEMTKKTNKKSLNLPLGQ